MLKSQYEDASSQSFQEFGGGYKREIIVVNDGSTDSTERIASEIAQQCAEVILITQDNSGPAGARETGLKCATGDYIAWVDSDDWVEPEWLLHLWENIKNYKADVSVCRAKIEGRKTTYNPQEKLVWDNADAIGEFLIHKRLNGCLWNKLFRRELFDDISFSTEMKYWEDLEVVWRILKKAKRVVRCDEGTYNFIVHPESLCAQRISCNRVYCTLKVWDQIVSDCQKKYPKHLSTALKKQEEWALSDLRSMISNDLLHSEYEDRIISIVRRAGLTGVLSQEGWANRIFALCVLCNIKLARRITKIYDLTRNRRRG